MRDFFRPYIVGVSALDFICIRNVLQFLPHMIKLLKITGISAFCMFFPFSGITPLKTDFRMFIFGLDLIRKSKEVLDGGVQLVLKLLCQSVIFDSHKTYVVISLA